MEYQLEQNLPALPNKVKSVMGVSTQARSLMEVGTEMKSVMYAVPEKMKTMFESCKRDFFVQWKNLLKWHNNDTKWNLQFLKNLSRN